MTQDSKVTSGHRNSQASLFRCAVGFAATLSCTLALGGPATALSCLPPDPVRMYLTADEAEIGYWIVLGRITMMGEPGEPKDGQDADTPVLITGMGLHLDGTYRPFAQPVTLRQTCLGPWCGGLPGEEDQFLAIAVTEEDGPMLVVDPCYSNVAPLTGDGEARLLACVKDGDCVTNMP